jgi:hypothetical protein
MDLKFEISNLRCAVIALILSTGVIPAQDGSGAGSDADGDGLQDTEELRYGLSPYLADSNQNGRLDIEQAQSWEVTFAPERPVWTVEWTPEVLGTYRFILASPEPLQLRINDAAVLSYAPNSFEVMGMPNEQVTLALESATPGVTPVAAARLTAFFIDGEDLDLDGLSMDWEMALHTDPAKADTDGDGLNDGEEVLDYGTDPLSTDSNQNGMPDYVEVLTVPAQHYVELEGYWEEKLESVACRNPMKAASYRLPLPYPGIYRVGVVLHPVSTASGTLKFFVDGAAQGEVSLQAGSVQLYHFVEVVLDQPISDDAGRPSLSHLVRVEWENGTQGVDAGELVIQQVYVDFIDRAQPEAQPGPAE